jgi:putative ABC transport system permease protein
VDQVLLQPLPFTNADRLVRVFENISTVMVGGRPLQGGMTYQEFLDWRARSTTLVDSVGFMPGRLVVRTGEGTARLWGGMVTGNAFTVLGTRALLGRTLEPADDIRQNVVVLGFDTWRRFFHSDPDIVGKTIESPASEMAGRSLFTVVGVLPHGFEFPARPMDYYTPVALNETSKKWASVTLIGRLRSGVSLQGAIDEANVIGSAIRPAPPADAPPLTVPRFEAQTLKDQVVQDLRPALRLLLSAVAVVLMIACANVANLLLARGTVRQGEIAVRFAIGASRGRVVRQLLTESLVLAIVGGAAGALLGVVGITLVKQLASVEAPGIFRLGLGSSILPRLNEVGVDPKMFGIAFGLAATTSLVFGVLPALHLSRADFSQAMGPRGGGADRRTSRIRTTLVIGQLVMATMLLVGAGLLARTFVKLITVDKGYDPFNVLAFQLVFPSDYPIARKTDTIESVLTRLRASPLVESAGFTRAGLLIGEQITLGEFVPEGRTADDMRAYPDRPRLRPISDGYLTAVGARVLEGRDLEPADTTGATPAIVISRTVARRFFGAGRAAGQAVNWHMPKGLTPLHIVGVVEDLRNTSPDREPYPEIFINYRQLLALQQQWGESTLRQNEYAIGLLSFAIRVRGQVASAGPAVGEIVRSVDPNIGIDAILPLERLVASSVARPRFYAVLLGVFAGVAGCLTAIGVYGVLAYAVVQRTREIGIRMALGAQRSQVLALVLRKGAALTTIGITLGLIAASVGTRVLQGLLFGITALDPTTFIVVSLIFGLVALLACYLPARRASRVDPMVALRVE